MPYEISDNTTNVVRPTLIKIQQKKKDTPQKRKQEQDKVQQERIRRVTYQPQLRLGRGRSAYDVSVLRLNEQRAQQMLEAEQLAKAEEEAKAVASALFTPLFITKHVGSAFHPDTHNVGDYVANLYATNNHGLAEVSDATRQWADQHPTDAAAINILGDITLPWTLTKGLQAVKPLATRLAESMPKVGFQQEGLRVGNYIYRAPRGQLNMGVPMPERVPAAEELAARKFFPVEEYGDAPIYSAETMPKIKVRRDWEAPAFEDNPSLDLTLMDYNFKHDAPMTPRQVFDDMNSRFTKSAHGRAVAFDEHGALSTDSYPLALNFFRRQLQAGLGLFFTPEQLERTPYVYLNGAGNRPLTLETVDFLNNKITRFNVETGMNVQPATLGEWYGKPAIQVQPIGFFKFRNGGLIGCIPDYLEI